MAAQFALGYSLENCLELEGSFGLVTIHEAVLQKIWLQQDFLTQNLRTYSGKPLRILNPGRWNHAAGPDFLEAQFCIDGLRLNGDVEVHFQAKDWFAHKHDQDPNFDGVKLHVLLFEPNESDFLSLCETGAYVLTLIDRLHYDLEQYASEQALLSLEQKDYASMLEGLLLQPPFDRLALLKHKALQRWRQKCSFVQKRIEQYGWDEALHQMTLEVLGYRRNRATMSKLALEYTLKHIESQPGQLQAQELFDAYSADWNLQNLRPANHPKKRLEQYLEVVYRTRHWPRIFKHLASGFTEKRQASLSYDSGTAQYRKDNSTGHLQHLVTHYVFQDLIAASKLDTLFADVLLPVLQTKVTDDIFPLWYHWHPGNAPDSLQNFLKSTGCIQAPVAPNSNGLQQGALQLFFESGL